LRRFEPLPAVIAAVAAAALLLPHCLARPHVLALPLLVLWAGLLLVARDAERPPPFMALPVMVLWANLHGSFLFGLALAAFLAGARDVGFGPAVCRLRHRPAPVVDPPGAVARPRPHDVATRPPRRPAGDCRAARPCRAAGAPPRGVDRGAGAVAADPLVRPTGA